MLDWKNCSSALARSGALRETPHPTLVGSLTGNAMARRSGSSRAQRNALSLPSTVKSTFASATSFTA
ncbi:hypothetical protein D3C71_1867550 [compost metagenome]